MSRPDAEDITGHIIGPEPEDEREHFLNCPSCGQAIDLRRLGDVLHHETPGHSPIPRQ